MCNGNFGIIRRSTCRRRRLKMVSRRLLRTSLTILCLAVTVVYFYADLKSIMTKRSVSSLEPSDDIELELFTRNQTPALEVNEKPSQPEAPRLPEMPTHSNIYIFADEEDRNKAYKAFTKVPGEDIWHYRAIAGNSTPRHFWDIVTVSGVWHERYNFTKISCCMIFKKNIVNVQIVSQMFRHPAVLESRFFICRNPRHALGQIPAGVTLVPSPDCPEDFDEYMPPHFPMKQDGLSAAICTLISYGNLNAEMMQEWIEVHSSLGVDKILVYAEDDINVNARKVIDFYKKTGIVEEMPYARVGGEEYAPGTQRDKNRVNYNFAQSVSWDCQQLLRGYTYVAILDWDEFVIPCDFENWKIIMNQVFMANPKAAAFKFYQYYYVVDWGVSNPTGLFNTTLYLNRTLVADVSRVKNVVMPERLPHGNLWIHEVLPGRGIQWLECPPEVAMIRHYRRCRHQWMVQDRFGNTKCSTMARVTDTTTIRYMEKIKDKVIANRKAIGL